MGTSPSTAVADDNIYEVTVQATDATEVGSGREAVKVEVTNVDEDGTVELSALQPAPSVAFTATLTDIDNHGCHYHYGLDEDLTSSAEWQWSRSTSKIQRLGDIDKATGSVYHTR